MSTDRRVTHLVYTEDRDQMRSGEYDVALVKQSIVYAAVCVRNGVLAQDAASVLPPSGTSAGWQPVPTEDIPMDEWHDPATPAGDRVYPTPCGDNNATHAHYLFSC